MLIQDREDFEQALSDVQSKQVFVCDMETTGVKPFNGDRLFGVALLAPETAKSGNTYYLPFRHQNGNNLPIQWLYELGPLFADPSCTWVNWNVVFDAHMIDVDDMSVHNQLADPMLAAHLVNENEANFRLKSLGAKYLGEEAADEEKALRKKVDKAVRETYNHQTNKKNWKGYMSLLTPEGVAPYAEEDTLLAWRLLSLYRRALKKQKLTDIWYEVNEYAEANRAMERRGILINREQCKRNFDYADKNCARLYEQMKEHVGHEFNPRSPTQMAKILDVDSTAKDTIKDMDNPVAEALLEYRAWDRAKSTYYQGFLDRMNENNRIHCSLLLIGTISGRLSCIDPNLQSLPKPKNKQQSDIYKVRDLVIAPPGHKLLSFDYSQIELRLLAHYTEDPFLIETFQAGEDLHSATADLIDRHREIAKRINYCIVYGGGANELSNQLDIPYEEANEILEDYHRQIPGIRRLYKACENFANQHGYITMWTGRRRHYQKGDETYKAMSNLIQGGVAEIMRHAITNIYKEIRYSKTYMTLQVHDELLFETPEEDALDVSHVIKAIMEEVGDFRVPILADGDIGDNWGGMEPIDFDA